VVHHTNLSLCQIMDACKTATKRKTALEPLKVGPDELLTSLPTWTVLRFRDLSMEIWTIIWQVTAKIEPTGQAHPSGDGFQWSCRTSYLVQCLQVQLLLFCFMKCSLESTRGFYRVMYHLEQQWETGWRPSYQVKYSTKHNFYINGISPIEFGKCSDKGKIETLNKFV